MNRKHFFELIDEKREYEDDKWGRLPGIWPDPDEWKLTVLTEEVGEVARGILERDIQQVFDELVDVAAVAVAWMEAIYETYEDSKKS